MNILNGIASAIQFLSEGIAQVFSRKNDRYPAIGMQPFDGEPLSKEVETINEFR
jgi:hypothetical protein